MIRLRTVAIAAALLIGGSADAFACPVCFGAEETAMIDGTKLGIVVMLAVTFAVQGAFAGFFFYLRRRARAMAEADLDNEWSNLQRASRTS
jgi:heme/copper-type cytochrome/quinol oxidase subunit 2